MNMSQGNEKGEEKDGGQKPEVARKPYQFLSISVLREYLALEMHIPNLPFKVNNPP